jgi:hypothetical protein
MILHPGGFGYATMGSALYSGTFLIGEITQEIIQEITHWKFEPFDWRNQLADLPIAGMIPVL